MKELTLPVEVRTQIRKGIGQLRRDGFIPGIFYLHGEGNITLKVKEKTILPLIMSAEARLLNLDFSPGGVRQGILREVQFDPLSDRPIHVDFQGIRADEELTLAVPIVLVGGIPIGVRLGGMLQHVLHNLEISCLPKHIPERIEINVGQLAIHHTIHVSDLKLENVTIITHAGDPIVSVIPPLVEKVATPEESAAEAKEPEVIAKGKKDEEGAEGTAEPAKGAAKAPAAKTAAKAPAKK